MNVRQFYAVCLLSMMFATINFAQQRPVTTSSSNVQMAPALVQTALIGTGNPPFHLRAIIAEKGSSSSFASVEIYWERVDQWRRTIQSNDFSQTLIVNGPNIFEQDSSDYFPLALRTLVDAIVDPKAVLDAWRPGDPAFTKANGLSRESGDVCLSTNAKRCLVYPWGLAEFVGGPAHAVWFTDYRKFKGKRVARRLIYRIDAGDSLTAQITRLDEFKSPSTDLFSIARPTLSNDRIRSLDLTQNELQKYAVQPLQIIWPQVLDGATSGEASYYVSIDRSGSVREVLPVSVTVERADDSARRQIMRWKFKPILVDGTPVQAGALLNFHFDTRAYGPAVPLTDGEVRRLASNVVQPEFPAGVAAGVTCSYRIAVDSEGYLIEAIADGCPSKLDIPALKAIQKWHFSPILEDGQPRPYRAEVTFRAP